MYIIYNCDQASEKGSKVTKHKIHKTFYAQKSQKPNTIMISVLLVFLSSKISLANCCVTLGPQIIIVCVRQAFKVSSIKSSNTV